MSVSAGSVETSRTISGYCAIKRASRGASTKDATGGGTVMRSCPAGRSRNALTESTAASNSSNNGRKRVSMRSPASVGATLRVVRLSSRTPRLSSSSRMVWLSELVDSPSCAAALVKLPQSATATKALSLAKRVSRIVEPNTRVLAKSRD